MSTYLIPLENHDKSPALELKPFQYIKALTKHVLPAVEGVVISRGNVVCYYKDDIRQCSLLLQDSVALHHRGDSIVLNSESAPSILGVSSQSSPEYLYAKALGTSEIAHVPPDCLNHIVAQLNLWERFSGPLVRTVSRVYGHCTQISQISVHDIIRFQLAEFIQELGVIR